jgi:hypothetical protein
MPELGVSTCHHGPVRGEHPALSCAGAFSHRIPSETAGRSRVNLMNVETIGSSRHSGVCEMAASIARRRLPRESTGRARFLSSLAVTLKTLQGERARINQELTKLDRAIAVIRELAGMEAAPNGRPAKRTVSVAARRKMAKAQKLRWAKVRAGSKAKA